MGEQKKRKGYNPDAVFSFPAYLEPDVSDFVNQPADEREVDIQELANEWLRANIKLVQSLSADGASKTT